MSWSKKIGAIVFCLSISSLYAQNDTLAYSNPNLIKHQIGIGISKFVNSAFSSDKNAYEIEYRYKYNKKIALRGGLIYEKDDSESGFVTAGLKIGIDKNLRKYQMWTIYYGVDVMGNYSNYKNIDKDIYASGIAPFLGIQFNLVKNFSVSIEPNIYLNYFVVVDNSTFENKKVQRWTESGLGKLGYIQLNFSF